MPPREKVTLSNLAEHKRAGRKFAVLTCYDYSHALIQEEAGVEVILVGDSAAQVVLGYPTTLPITMDVMVTLAAAVRRGAPSPLLIGDMPYLSFNISVPEAIRNAGRFMAEAGCDAVKIEGDGRLVDTVAAMSAASIPVVAHLGLRPQAVHLAGGYRAQSRTADAARALIADAQALAAAGAAMILVEAVPPEPAQRVARSVDVPVIGCGAGAGCDGHVVVLHDMLGLSAGPVPRFIRRYADLRTDISRAVREYISDIQTGKYPAAEHAYSMLPGEAEKLARG